MFRSWERRVVLLEIVGVMGADKMYWEMLTQVCGKQMVQMAAGTQGQRKLG